MSVSRIVIKLNEKSIDNAIKGLSAYRDSLKARTNKLINDLAVEGGKVAIAIVAESAYYSFKGIVEGIKAVSIGEGKAVVVSEAPQSMFFEFGTGIVGERNRYPDQKILAILGWKYDVNSHGELGWWYPTDESDGNPYKWTSPEGQLYAWTKGMPSRPYMYETAQVLRTIVVDRAKEVFRYDNSKR